MGLLTPKTPWYAAGLAFQCQGCGRCCAGPQEGYVWITRQEMASIAEYLGMTPGRFEEKYVRTVGRRLSLIEQEPSRDCVFLTSDPQDPTRRTCMIYPVRPTQCRTWPFWPSNLSSARAWNEAARRCPGMNRGPVHDLDEIMGKVKATVE